jgi:NitT/TauT family transport system ATP-binding protein
MANIVFDGVEKKFTQGGKEFLAVGETNFMVADKEFVAIVGPSGCGKTTCLRMVAGFEAPTKGVIRVGGEIVTAPGPDRAVVFQQFALFPWKTVLDNITFGLKAMGLDESERNQTRVVMQEELVKLARKNPRTVLFITHAVEEAVYLADRVVVMSRRPGLIKEVIDVKKIRLDERWDEHVRIEDVMDLSSFVHLRSQIWKLLREQH